jgi:hypothetical protein
MLSDFQVFPILLSTRMAASRASITTRSGSRSWRKAMSGSPCAAAAARRW